MIQPISLPDGAGINYADGDVRHFAPNDGFSVPAIATPTRQLAYRDNALATKVNELVTEVNNKEQYVNIPIFRTFLPPTQSEVVTNYRIPIGFEARILNAAISSTPANLGRIEIFHSPQTYGMSNGESLTTLELPISTLNEFTSDTEFKGTGEFIVRVTNVGSISGEFVASVILTMRPVAPPGGALLSPGAQVYRGDKGDKGDQGDPGAPGIGIKGDDGDPGLVWKGNWAAVDGFSNPVVYSLNDVVFYQGSSYVSLQNSNSGHTPSTSGSFTDSWWQVIARVGTAGAAVKEFVWQGTWSVSGRPATRPDGISQATGDYQKGDVVNYTASGVTRTFYADGSSTPVTGTAPPASGWAELFGPSTLPAIGDATRNALATKEVGCTSAFLSGTATSGGATTLTDSGLAMSTNQYANYLILIKTGTGAGQTKIISSNNATVFTITTTFSPAPDNTSTYDILEPTSTQGDYVNLIATSSTFNLPLRECYFEGSATGGIKGFAFLYGAFRYTAKGKLTVTLPQKAGGAKINWTSMTGLGNPSGVVQCVASSNGIMPAQTANAVKLVTVTGVGTTQYTIESTATDPSHVDVFFFGTAAIT
jgi:hypothetical protein